MHLSPARGAALAESNVLRNLYVSGDPAASATVQLVKELFHQPVPYAPLQHTRRK